MEFLLTMFGQCHQRNDNKGDIIVGVNYRLAGEAEVMDECLMCQMTHLSGEAQDSDNGRFELSCHLLEI